MTNSFDYDTSPAEIICLAFELEKRLKWLRENQERATPARPIMRRELSELHWKSVPNLTKTNLCHAMHYAHSQLLPIGSSGGGYFYVNHPDELDCTLAIFIKRTKSCQAVIGWVQKTQEAMWRKLNAAKQPTLFESQDRERER